MTDSYEQELQKDLKISITNEVAQSEQIAMFNTIFLYKKKRIALNVRCLACYEHTVNRISQFVISLLLMWKPA